MNKIECDRWEVAMNIDGRYISTLYLSTLLAGNVMFPWLLSIPLTAWKRSRIGRRREETR